MFYVRSLHDQLVHELPQENFSEKRVNLLKSQVVQLERQVLNNLPRPHAYKFGGGKKKQSLI